MTIKELEQLVGLPRASIRFYEQEGFLSPRRLKNNYRDYSPEDVRTLGKIKLLRQLHLDLESIRRLEAGELTLSQALTDQLSALDADRSALDRAGEVCQSLLRAGADYAALDPVPWLEELERRPAPSGPHLASPSDTLNVPSPWRRFFARRIDDALYTLPWLILQSFFLYDSINLNNTDPTVLLVMLIFPIPFLFYYVWSSLVCTLTALLLEPIFLCIFGATPGKWILGLEVRRADGGHLTWSEARSRTISVVARGEGFYLPIISLWRLYRSYRACADGQVLPWDEGLCYTQRPRGLAWRVPLLACWSLVLLLVRYAASDLSYVPPHPQGTMTSAALAENANFFRDRLMDSDDTSLTVEDGQLSFDWNNSLPPVWRKSDLTITGGSAVTGLSYTARLDPSLLKEPRRDPPYSVAGALEKDVILAFSCAARPWPLLLSQEEISQAESELGQLLSAPLTPPVTRLDKVLSCGVRLQAVVNAPGYLGLDGTAEQLVWGKQPAPPEPVCVQVTLSLA